MFRLHRHKSDKSGDRIDFKFTNLQAVKVPKGWDKLIVSIISVETGKSVAKSSKAHVRNGNCQWAESLSESIWIPQDDSSKETEDCLYKLVISMGSSRSGILGEAIINLTTYTNSRASGPIYLPLKQCSYGTILQVKVHCLNPRRQVGDEQWREKTSSVEDTSANHDEMDNKSDASDNSFGRSGGSSSSIHLGSSSQPGEHGSRNTSFSASGSRHSSDSAEGSIDRTNFSPKNNLNGDLSPVARQDSGGSQNGAPYAAGLVEDLSRSNHSSFNSKFSGSGNNLQNQRQEVGQNSLNVIGTSSLRNVSSSKDLLESAEDTIEELRAEAKMWERNARKLMLDLEILKKESADQSRHEADLDMELSAANTERDGLKQEITLLKELIDESKVKQVAAETSISQAEGINNIQKELESELRFQKESNANLSLQLKKTQESNLELVAILQELEETIENMKLEIDNLSAEKELNAAVNRGQGKEDSEIRKEGESYDLELKLQNLQESQKELQACVNLLERTIDEKNKELELERDLRHQTLLKIEAEWNSKLSKKEDEITNLEAKISDLFNCQNANDMRVADAGDSGLKKEIEILKEKVQELESDCNELTEENLDLVYKLKESKKGLASGGNSFSSSSSEHQTNVSVSATESEADFLRAQIYELKEELRKKALLYEGNNTNHLQVQLIKLGNKITDLEFQLQSSQDKASELDAQLHSSQAKIDEREMEITTLKQQMESYQGKETRKENQGSVVTNRGERFESEISLETSKMFSDLYGQLHLAMCHVKKPWYNGSSPINTPWKTDHEELVDSDGKLMGTKDQQVEAILKTLGEVNKLLEVKISECDTVFQHNEAELKRRDVSVTKDQKNMETNQELESLGMKLESKVADLRKELTAKTSEAKDLEASMERKEEEIKILRTSQEELKAQISDLLQEKDQLEENLEIVSRESSLTSKCLDDLRNDMAVLSSSLDSHVFSNKMLERKLSELESGKQELEAHLSELEEENVQLSERISGLEAQLRYLTDEKESHRLELENSKSLATDFRNEIERLAIELDTQKVDLKQKLQDMQKRWSEAQEECEYLKRANPKLQATAENLMEECSSVQKSNAELKRQKLELHDHCMHLEAELRESRSSFSDCCKKVELLESKLSSMQEDVASKEKLLTSELDVLLQENKEHKKKLILEESLLSQMYSEKAMEVESLQREVSHLNEQMCATHDERERIASDAVLEVSTLRADKMKLETALQEAQAKVKLSETALHTLQAESGHKVEGLINDVSSYKKNQELLTADQEKLQKWLDEVKYSEDRYKSTVNSLELKLTASEYERKQLAEEIDGLKVQLQKISQLQDEIVTLKNSLNEVKFEKGKLETSLQMLSGDCEELKTERASFLEKISNMQKSVSDLEDRKRSRISLEEKLLRLEGDISAKEALCAQDAELKNELSRIKRANSQFQRKIQILEEEKEESMQRAQTLEEELKLKKEENQHHSKFANKDLPAYESKVNSSHEEVELSEFQGGNKHGDHSRKPQSTGVDLLSKIETLENELAEALEANNMYKLQLKNLLTNDQNGHANSSTKSNSENVLVSNDGWEAKANSLEGELKDIRERYFNMSLRFAEVEAQREELVMKFKALKNGKRWFSMS